MKSQILLAAAASVLGVLGSAAAAPKPTVNSDKLRQATSEIAPTSELIAVRIDKRRDATGISQSNGMTCVRRGTRSMECFGATYKKQRFNLPEAIDQQTGGDVLCVHGVNSNSWFCRDNLAIWFSTVPKFERVVSQHPIVTLDVDDSAAIRFADETGARYIFAFASNRKPLAFKLDTNAPAGDAVEIRGASSRFADGHAEIHREQNTYRHGDDSGSTQVSDAVAVGNSNCYVNTSHTFRCKNDAQQWNDVITKVAQWAPGLSALVQDDGTLWTQVFADGHLAYIRVDKAPKMLSLAYNCGISQTGELWSWHR